MAREIGSFLLIGTGCVCPKVDSSVVPVLRKRHDYSRSCGKLPFGVFPQSLFIVLVGGGFAAGGLPALLWRTAPFTTPAKKE